MEDYEEVIVYVSTISCTTTKYIKIPVEHTRIEYSDRIKHDSIYLRDNIVQKKEKLKPFWRAKWN